MKSPIAIVSEHVDLATLAATINVEHATAGQHLGKALEHARRAGDALLKAKDSLPHGRFGSWMKSHCQFSERTARNYMLVARNWQAIESTDVESVRDAVRMLTAVDSDPDPEIGNALPFCLPPVGQTLIGLGGGEDFVVIEGIDENFVRIAAKYADDRMVFTKRGVNRKHVDRQLGLLMKAMGIDQSTIDWIPLLPATAENNPLSAAIPEWKYEVSA